MMKPLSDLFEDMLRSDGVKFVSEPAADSHESTDYTSAFQTSSCDVVVNTHIDEGERSMRLSSSIGLRIPNERYVDVSRRIMIMNHTLIIGFYLVSPLTKEVELIVTAAYPDMSPSAMCLRRLLQTAIYCASQNYETFVGMLHGPQDVGPSPDQIDEVGANLIGFAVPDDAESPETLGDSAEAVAKKPARRRRKRSDEQ